MSEAADNQESGAPPAEISGGAVADPIDEEAAEIDARAPEAAEQIEELVEHAQDLGRDTAAD